MLLKFCFQLVDDREVCGEPVDVVQIGGVQPSRGFVFEELELAGFHAAEVAFHRKMEGRIVPLYGVEITVDFDFGGQFFPDLTDDGILRPLAFRSCTIFRQA